MKRIAYTSLLLPFLLSITRPMAAQNARDTTGLSTREEHYQFLREDLANYRQFIKDERRAHRQFLEDTYRNILILVTVGLAILGFLGVRSWKNLREKLELEYRNQIKAIIDSQLLATEQKIEALNQLVHQESMWRNQAKLRFVVPEARLKAFLDTELAYFGGKKPNFVVGPLTEEETFEQFDVIVYYLAKDGDGEDEVLQQIVRKVAGRTIPIVVYTHGERLDFKSATSQDLQNYQFHNFANNIITLLNNTADAFRLKLNT